MDELLASLMTPSEERALAFSRNALQTSASRMSDLRQSVAKIVKAEEQMEVVLREASRTLTAWTSSSNIQPQHQSISSPFEAFIQDKWRIVAKEIESVIGSWFDALHGELDGIYKDLVKQRTTAESALQDAIKDLLASGSTDSSKQREDPWLQQQEMLRACHQYSAFKDRYVDILASLYERTRSLSKRLSLDLARFLSCPESAFFLDEDDLTFRESSHLDPDALFTSLKSILSAGNSNSLASLNTSTWIHGDTVLRRSSSVFKAWFSSAVSSRPSSAAWSRHRVFLVATLNGFLHQFDLPEGVNALNPLEPLPQKLSPSASFDLFTTPQPCVEVTDQSICIWTLKRSASSDAKILAQYRSPSQQAMRQWVECLTRLIASRQHQQQQVTAPVDLAPRSASPAIRKPVQLGASKRAASQSPVGASVITTTNEPSPSNTEYESVVEDQSVRRESSSIFVPDDEDNPW